MSGGTAANRDFFEFVKSIGESKSKQEEDQIISEEVVHLKKKLTESNIPKKKMKEILARAIYIEMLGKLKAWGLIYTCPSLPHAHTHTHTNFFTIYVT